MADYNISAIRTTKKETTEYISQVHLHEIINGVRQDPKWTSKDEVIKLINSKKKIITIVWDYKEAKWSDGAEVSEEHLKKEYLRTKPDRTVTNNLHNLPHMGV